jgi:type III secretion protein O
MTVFQKLLALRRFREERAEAIVRAERAALHSATQARDDAAARLQEFQDLASQREQALFSALMSHPVLLRDIEGVRDEVADLRWRERGFCDALDQAEMARARQEHAVSAARSHHQLAEKAKQKFAEIVSAEKIAHQARRDRAEEAQSDELAGSGARANASHPAGSDSSG